MKEHPNWKSLCHEHARKIMICPCYIVEKSECDECKKSNDIEHNQCEICLRVFETARGFHRHYIQCVGNEILKSRGGKIKIDKS